MNTSRLYECLYPALDYTNHDVIVETLLDIVTCPIAIEVSDTMVFLTINATTRYYLMGTRKMNTKGIKG